MKNYNQYKKNAFFVKKLCSTCKNYDHSFDGWSKPCAAYKLNKEKFKHFNLNESQPIYLEIMDDECVNVIDHIRLTDEIIER